MIGFRSIAWPCWFWPWQPPLLLGRPSVANVIVGARDEEQLRANLGAVGWALTADQVGRLDDASRRSPIYPYWHQMDFGERNSKPTRW